MQKILLLGAFLILFSEGFAQDKESTKRPKLNESSVVIDETGKQYSYEEWSKILKKGDFGVVYRKSDGKDVFMLKRYTEEQKRERQAAIPKPKPSPAFETGSSFRYSDNKTIDGVKIKKQDLVGKVLVFNFWFIACPPCRQEMPHLNELVEKYKDRDDVLFLGVALDESYEVGQFLKSTPFAYQQLRGGRAISTAFDVKAFPTHLIVDKNGVVQFSAQGFGRGTIPWIEKTIESLL
ncbi:TlpA family protein disulfide reductase [Pseudopedobacter beijingensis]|uniref:TlpA family protein disulfide reductase n=1 Tax=Pseudopedobacter beijingensis TaxID=1207056 RepID=A0ABW4IFN1_9SPHI